MKCDKCDNAGFTFSENPDTKEMEGIPCECRRIYDQKKIEGALHSKFNAAGISSSFWGYTFDGFFSCRIGGTEVQKTNKVKVEELKKYSSNPGDFFSKHSTLWIWGNEGNSGCTTLSICFAMELIKKNYTVRFVTMQKLLNAFTDFDNKKNFFKEIERADVYVIDSTFVKDRCSIRGEYTSVQLYDWLNNALLDGKKFICTSRVPLDRVDKEYTGSASIFKKSLVTVEIQGTLMEEA